MDEITTDQRIAQEIKTELRKRRMSQAALARRINITPFAMSRRLRGEVPFSANEVTAAAGVLEVPVEQFLQAAS